VHELTCTIEILSIGNELLLGNTVNTNASWIATQSTAAGGKLTRITTVADDLDEISTAIHESLRRKPDFLITTGGIGPTFDDMTFRGVARALKMRLRVDPAALALMRKHYSRRFPDQRLRLTKPRLKMATIPSAAIPLRNPVGTAPGLRLRVGRTTLFCLPGVPREAKVIFKQSILTEIGVKSAGSIFAENWIKVRGIGESTLAPAIDRIMRQWPGLYVKSHARGIYGGEPFVELHLSISSKDRDKAARTLRFAARAIGKELRSIRARLSK
jgi:nicotinamide-nucleotide amidase